MKITFVGVVLIVAGVIALLLVVRALNNPPDGNSGPEQSQ